MAQISLIINKESVYAEVAQTTQYTGSKMPGEDSYDRILTTDNDKPMLERFWNECKNAACNGLKKIIASESESNGTYTLSLNLSGSFDSNLTPSMQSSLFSFFVMSITAKWYAFTNKSEAGSYADEATSYLDDVMRKAFHKKRPTRPTYSQE